MFQTSTESSWRLFEIDGHPIYVHPMFVALIVLFAFLGVSAQNSSIMTLVWNLGVWVPTLFLGILLHELGHATAMKRFGYGTSDILLHGFGGVTINRRRQGAPSGQSIVISLAGPFVSFLLAFVSFLAYYLMPSSVPFLGSSNGLLYWMGFINAFWGIFNLLPINPLDGGHVVLHALRGKLRNQRKAARYTAIVSLVTVGLLVGVTLVVPFLDPFFAIILAGIFGLMNWRMLKSTEQRGGGPRNPYGRY